MKIHEKIKEENKDMNFTSKGNIYLYMYQHRIIPCDLNEVTNYISAEKLNALCAKHELNCPDCCEEYLDIELEEEKEEAKRLSDAENQVENE